MSDNDSTENCLDFAYFLELELIQHYDELEDPLPIHQPNIKPKHTNNDET